MQSNKLIDFRTILITMTRDDDDQNNMNFAMHIHWNWTEIHCKRCVENYYVREYQAHCQEKRFIFSRQQKLIKRACLSRTRGWNLNGFSSVRCEHPPNFDSFIYIAFLRMAEDAKLNYLTQGTFVHDWSAYKLSIITFSSDHSSQPSKIIYDKRYFCIIL